MLITDRAKRIGQLPDSLELMLHESHSINVTGDGDWWTTRKLVAVSSILAVLLLLLAMWSLALRNRVKQRNALLVQEIRARRDSELVTSERMRLASDLHDTLSQSLSGAAMQLEIASAAGCGSPRMENHFMLARRLLDRGREDLRRAVWDLNPTMLEGHGFIEALTELAGEINDGGTCHVSVDGDPTFEDIPERIRVHLFHVAQEAIHNAIRHGKASDIRVSLDHEVTGLILIISDNGRGFDPGSAAGPKEGHFGLRSMKERIERLGGSLEIRSACGSTEIIAMIPSVSVSSWNPSTRHP